MTEPGNRERNERKRPLLLLLFVQFTLITSAFSILPSCGIYSFTGATIPEHLQSISIPLTEVRAQSAVSDLDRQLTDALIDRFVDRSRLSLEPNEEAADALLRSSVRTYALTPVAVTGDEIASLNRVTISVEIRYIDRSRDEVLLDRSFTASADYDPAEGPAGETEAVARAVDQLANDVFSAATSNW